MIKGLLTFLLLINGDLKNNFHISQQGSLFGPIVSRVDFRLRPSYSRRTPHLHKEKLYLLFIFGVSSVTGGLRIVQRGQIARNFCKEGDLKKQAANFYHRLNGSLWIAALIMNNAMNYSISYLCYPQQPSYTILNPHVMFYAQPIVPSAQILDLSKMNQILQITESKENSYETSETPVKTEDQYSGDQFKPAINLTESDLSKYIGNVNRKLWTEEEDQLLQRLAKEHSLDWKTIAASFPERNPNQCYGRYRRIIRDSKRKGWSKREDEMLIECVEKYGQNWKAFTKNLPNRTSKQIRQRYLNSLRPNIVVEDWKVEEDLKICGLINKYGKKWKLFEEFLPGRTENRIKNRYYGHIKKIHSLKLKQNRYKEIRKSKMLRN